MELSRKPLPGGSSTGLSTEKANKASAAFNKVAEWVYNKSAKTYSPKAMLHNIPFRVYDTGSGTNKPETVPANNGGVFNTFVAKFNGP